MGRTKELLIQEDWEMEWQKDFVYLLEKQRLDEQKELYERYPAMIKVVDKRKTKKKDESEPTYLPF